MNKPLLYIVPVLLIIASCKKNPLPNEEESGDPVFYIKADVESVPLNIQAGKDDYYMYSSHYQQSNGVYVYKGELKPKTASNGVGNYGISILINDFKVSAQNASMMPDSGLHAGNYVFNDGNLPPYGYNVTFNANSSATNYYTWNFGNGTFLPKTLGNISVNAYYKPGTYTVSLEAFKPTNNQTFNHTNVFNMGSELQTTISATRIDPYTSYKYSFTAPASKSGITYYSWDFGDGYTSTNESPEHEFPAPQAPVAYYAQRISLRMINGVDTCYSYYQLVVTDAQGVINANFTPSVSPVENKNALSAITIQLTDPNGLTFTSADYDQPTENKFEIVSVEDYKTNDAGEKTKKVKIRFNCTVERDQSIIRVKNGEAVIAVSYK